MKNLVCCLLFLPIAWGVQAQSSDQTALAQQAAGKLAGYYDLDAQQQSKMLEVQQRKYRNLSEIEPLKTSNPSLYFKKVEALQLANTKSIERLLTKEQLPLLRQQQSALRNEKAQVYKEMKQAGASQQEMDQKLSEVYLKSLQ